MKLKLTTLVILLICVWDAYSQEKKQAPIPIEVVFGNSRYGIQTIINRQLPKTEKLSFFSVTYIDNDYENNIANLEYSNVSQLIYDIYKGIGVSMV